MPQTVREPSKGAKYAIFYLTAGALVIIWSAVWFYYLVQHDYSAGDIRYYLCTGLLLSGVAVFVIGALIGRIGHEAKQADVPVATVATPATNPAPPPTPSRANGATGAPAPAPVQQPVTAPR